MAEISVIVPVYNTCRYVGDCLESICNNTVFDKCEIIVIDDGSTDQSRAVVAGYVEQYENITLYTFPNGGVSCARNRGLSHARGKYVFFLDSDDLVGKDYLNKLFTAIEREQCDVVFAGFTQVDESGRNPVPQERSVLNLTKSISGPAFLEKRMEAEDWNNQVWCAIYRREFLQNCQIVFAEEVTLYEDILFTNEVLLRAGTVYAIPEYGYLYRIHDRSLVHGGMSEKDTQNLMRILENFTERYDALSDPQRHAAARMYFQLLSMLLYDLGAVNPPDKKQYYRRIRACKVLEALKHSCSCGKERVKLLVFSLGLQWYYPVIRMKEGRAWGNMKK